MADIKLTDEEVLILRLVLAKIVIKAGTGELGILHGMNRFVSTQISLRKPDREKLDVLAKKLGLSSGIRVYDKG
jgi:hypothetical protein